MEGECCGRINVTLRVITYLDGGNDTYFLGHYAHRGTDDVCA